jgi:hypothetical protein
MFALGQWKRSKGCDDRDLDRVYPINPQVCILQDFEPNERAASLMRLMKDVREHPLIFDRPGGFIS